MALQEIRQPLPRLEGQTRKRSARRERNRRMRASRGNKPNRCAFINVGGWRTRAADVYLLESRCRPHCGGRNPSPD
eukprot:2597534-Amphidinium_carterae.1